jgi:hypothetical protein
MPIFSALAGYLPSVPSLQVYLEVLDIAYDNGYY